MLVRSPGSLLLPLLTAFRHRPIDPRKQPSPTSPRTLAIETAATDWLNPAFLDRAGDEVLIGKLTQFYRDVVALPFHDDVFRRKPGLVRFGLNHLLHAHDPLPQRLARCAFPDGEYFRPGLGVAFWFAIAKAMNPSRLPDWRPIVVRGLVQVGLLSPTLPRSGCDRFAAACKVYDRLQAEFPDLTAQRLDEFFCRVANREGRELGECDDPFEPTVESIAESLRFVRTDLPLRKRMALATESITQLRDAVDAAIGSGCAETVLPLASAFLGAGERRPESTVPEWLPTIVAVSQSLKATTDLLKPPLEANSISRVAEMELLATLLHVKHPNRFPLWCDTTRRGVQLLSDAISPALPVWEQYRLTCDVVDRLREQFRVHSCEVVPLLAKMMERYAEPVSEPVPSSRVDHRKFHGFCTDSFQFLAELHINNASDWMAIHRERYSFAVREPLVELCEALTLRYIRPVLQGEYGWELETDAKPGRSISSICKNDFGRATAYQSDLWIMFYRRGTDAKRHDVQFFVRLHADGITYGFHLGRTARDAGKRFRKVVQDHGEAVFAALNASGVLSQCQFSATLDRPTVTTQPVQSVADLRAWSVGKDLFAWKTLTPDSPVVRRDELVGEILLTFDRLLPLFAAAVSDDPQPILARRAGHPNTRPAFDREAFHESTYLSDLWLSRALDLLQSKKQLILQGVPGTGKTHVARQLARYITHDRTPNIRLVQFHPGYSYEEFVEGIRPRTVEVNGHNELSYSVEAGVLATFVEQAMKCPAEPHVLVIDEINRGNLPRVFGELLFLLEYRDHEVTLLYSKQQFRIPNNLFILGTMNPIDHSVASIDQALRRRFSFVEMQPDPALLAHWFDANPPAEPDTAFAPQLVKWFDDLNHRLSRDAGPDRQVGHSFFMIPQMSRDQLRTIWQHQVRPLLEGTYPGRPDRIDALAPERLLGSKPKRPPTNPSPVPESVHS